MLDTTKLRADWMKSRVGGVLADGVSFHLQAEMLNEIADFFISKFESLQKSLLEEVENVGDFGEGTYPEKDGKVYATKDFKIGYSAAKDDIKALLTKNLEK